MKKVIIASIVGAVILFLYQWLSWEVIGLHKSSFKSTAGQDEILSTISKNIKEEGVYVLPKMSDEGSMEERQKAREEMMNKPYAFVTYHPAMKEEMASQMIIGFIVNLLAVLMLALVLNMPGMSGSFVSRFILSMGFALVIICQSSLMSWNWMRTPMHNVSGEIIDTLIGWALVGAWMGWYMKTKQQTTVPAEKAEMPMETGA